MRKIAIVRSRHLIDNEGKGQSRDYGASSHRKGIDAIVEALKAFDIPYVIIDENEISPGRIAGEGVGVVVIPEMRVCAEAVFQRLVSLAEQGWVVFSGIDSFYYNRENGTTERVRSARIRYLFGLPPDSRIQTLLLVKGQIRFRNTRFAWLTEGLPASIDYSGRHRWIMALRGESDSLLSHGDILVGEAKRSDSKVVDTSLRETTFPAFLVREYQDSGGIFIFACLSLRRLENHKRVLRNLAMFRDTPKPGLSQVRFLKILVAALTGVVGLLLAREIMGNTLSVSAGGIVTGLILGVMGNKLTDLCDRWMEHH